MPDKPNEAEAIFLAALEIETPEERSVYVNTTCVADARLLARVKALLEAHDHSDSFLEKPPAELAGTMSGDRSGAVRAESLQAGLASAFSIGEAVVLGDANHSVLKMLGNTLNEVPHVSLREPKAEGADPIARPSSPEMPGNNSDSRYQLQGEIARGGMGAIIKGRDTDLGRDLAIKVLLDSHKDKPEVIQRFVEEAQIGGQLQHPGIAPVYELGQFADQRPFFAMKLVKGETLSTLLDEREQASDERGKFLGIFEQVCQTMAYAHSRGVIHRDLKSANIMVGAFGEVQVMDWGLAKVLPKGGVADEKKAKQTQHGRSIIQTMRSAGSDAPGSFGSSGSDTQMGSVMGTPAYMPPEQALGEIDQMDERADVFGLGAILCEILTGKPPYAAEDGTQVYRLASRGKLDGCFARLETCGADAELVRLTKHCLELEPSDRPRNAGILAESISGYLESVETKLRETELASVDAQVRAEELRRRQRLTFTAGTAIAATLLVGIAASLWQMSRATVAEKLTAETLLNVEAERDAKELALQDAEDISKFLADVLQSPDTTRDGREIKVVDLLDTAREKLEKDLVGQPAQRAKLQAALGGTYCKLGLYKSAVALQEQVRDHHLEQSGVEHPDTLMAISNLASSCHAAGRRDEALSMREKVRELREDELGFKHPDTLMAMHNLALSYFAAGRLDEAISMQEKVLELRREELGRKHADTLRSMSNLALFYVKAGRGDEAFSMREKVLKLMDEELGPRHADTLLMRSNLAESHFSAGRREEALLMQKKVSDLMNEVLGEEHPRALREMAILAWYHSAAGNLDEALEIRKKALERTESALGKERPDMLVVAMAFLASSYSSVDRHDDALAMQKKAMEISREELDPDHPLTLAAKTALAYCYAVSGFHDEAVLLREQVRDYHRDNSGREHTKTLRAMWSLASSYSAAGRHDEAISLWEQFRDYHSDNSGPEHTETLRANWSLASSYSAAGRHDEAISMWEQIRDCHEDNSGPEQTETLRAMAGLASSYSAAGRHDEAVSMWEQVRDYHRDNPGSKHAATWARRAMELKTNDGGLLNTLGVPLYRFEHWQEAIDVLQKSIKLGFDRPRNWLFLAMAYWQLDKTDEAQRWYDKSLAWQSTHPDKLEADAELRGFYAEAAKLMSAGGEEESMSDDKTESSDADPAQAAGRDALSEITPTSTDEDDNEPEAVEESSLEKSNVPK